MICKECGNEILPGMLFCTNCGAKAEAASQEADSDKTVVLWDEEPQQPKQDDDRTVVLWDEEPQQPKQDDDRTVVLWDEEPQQPKQDDDRTVVLWDEEPQQPAQNSGATKCCPNCGSNNAGDALFCVECGALMAETKPQPSAPSVTPSPQKEQSPEQQPKAKKEKKPKKPKQPKAPKQEGEAIDKNKLLIIIGAAAAVVVVIIGAIFVINGLSSKSSGRDLVYLKDNEVYMAKGGSFKPKLITDSFFDDADDADNIGVYSNEYSSIQYTEDGKYVFYPQDKANGEYDLYYKKAGSKEEGTKLESGVSSYQAYSKDKIFYEKGNKLYLANLKDKEKIASDVSWYGVSADRKYFYWNEYDNGEYTYFIQDINLKKEEVKIKDVSQVISMGDSYEEIYYMSGDTLYLMKNRTDKIKIASDVDMAYMLGEGDNKKLYYFTLEDDEAYACADFVKDDVKENSEYSEYEEYVLEDLEYYSLNILEYKVYSYSAGSDKSEEVTSFTGHKTEVTSYGSKARMMMYFDVDVEAVDKMKLSDIIEDFYYNYSDISVEQAIESKLLEQASFYLMTDKELIAISGMEEFYEKPGKVQPDDFCINTKTDEIYMSVAYYDEEDGTTYDLYIIPYTEKEVECRLITNELYKGNLVTAENGVYYVCDVDKRGEEGTLFLNGIEIDQDVYPSDWERSGDSLYYLKDINSDREGTLCKNTNGKITEIAEDVVVDGYLPIKDENVAYLMDYSFKKNKGDLFVFTGRKSIAVDTDVSAILR